MLLLFTPAFALPLMTERFDAAPADWKERVIEGKGAATKVVYADGVATITAAPSTKKFVAFGKRFDARGIEWLEVQAKVTATGVEGAAPNAVCGAYVRFDTGEIVPTRACTLRADAESHTRYLPVPAGARDFEVGVLLTTAGTVTVDDLVVSAATPPLKSLTRGPFTYHWLQSDALRDDALEANDTRFDQLTAFFGLERGAHLDYWKYPNAEALESYTGEKRAYVAGASTVHTVLWGDMRGMVDALARAWGDPPEFLSAGLAIHLAGDWDGRDPKLTTRQQVNAGTAVDLAVLLDPAQVATLAPDKVYPQAGAFVSWVVATKGSAGVQALYAALSRTATPAANRAAMEKVLGKPLDAIQAEFRAGI